MKSFKEFKNNLHSAPSDCTGIDIGSTITKVVRLKAVGSEINVLGADLIEPSSNGNITIPLALRARYASIATSCSSTIIKLLTFTGAIDASFERSLPHKLGINADEDYRISHSAITEGNSRTESIVLAAALPEDDAKPIMQQFASGIPAPYSFEITTLAALHAFEHSALANENSSNKTTGLIDFGTNETFLSIFHKRKLVLIRKFDFGTNIVMESLKSTLHVSADIARGMLDDAAFDISDILGELMSSIASELIISRDFIERDKNCKIDLLYAIGGIALSKTAMQSLEKDMSIDIKLWDPFDGLTLASQALEKNIEEQRWRFAGAIGAALATLEEK